MKIKEFYESIAQIEGILGYTFRDKSLLCQAFTRSSWCNEHGPDEYQSNEVLEFFGDSVLAAAVVTLLLDGCSRRYEHGIRTELGEGDFSNIKSRLSDKTNLSGSTKRLGLEAYLLLGEGDAKLGIADEPSVMEDLFESIVGAVYIDSGRDMREVIRLVGRILDTSVYTEGKAHSVSPKNELQEWCADKKRRLPPPVYKTVGEEGPDHKKSYTRAVFIGDRMIASASGKNQKSADAEAARAALAILASEESEASARDEAVTSASPVPEESVREGAHNEAATQEAPEESSSAKSKAPKKKGASSRAGRTAKSTASAKAQDDDIYTEAPKVGSQKKKSPPKRSEAKDISASVIGRVGAGARRTAESAVSRLKRHAESDSVAPPTFRDLGMGSDGEGGIAYRVECSFKGKKMTASADSRIEARERAAALVVRALKLK